MILKKKENFDLIKSKGDKRSYGYVKLDNGLRAVIVSDTETEKSSACLRVNIGSFADPKCFPGLAHFLEHMLFLGTKEFPQEDFLENFLQENGGGTNAYTEDESTLYFYEVHHSALKESVRRFATMFTFPLMREDSTGREINAIQSEFEMNFQSDFWRIHQIFYSLSGDSCILNRFSIGSKETLLKESKKGENSLHNELHSFYNNFYSSHLMCLCLVGRESLEEMEKLVRDNFSKIKTKNAEPPSVDIYPLEHPFQNKVLMLEGVKKKKYLYILWDAPSVNKDLDSKPHILVSHVVGNERKGSLYFVLRENGLASSLATDSFIENTGIYVFSTKIKLTEKGSRNIERILVMLFQYLEMMRKMDNEEWLRVYEDTSAIDQSVFDYKSKEEPSNYAQQICKNMNFYDPEEVLSGPYLLKTFDVKKIRDFIAHLRVENMRCFFANPDFSLQTKNESETKREPFFGTKYIFKEISKECLNQLSFPAENPILNPPEKNDYIARNFSLLFSPNKKLNTFPEKIHSNKLFESFFLPDNHFEKPVGFIILFVETPSVYATPEGALMARIFQKYFEVFTKTEIYDAEVAGIYSLVSFEKDGMGIEVNGFNENLPKLFSTIIEKMFSDKKEEKRFKAAKEEVLKDLETFDVAPVRRRNAHNRSWVLENLHWHPKELCKIMERMSFDRFSAFLADFFCPCYSKLFMAGNLSRSDADSISKFLCNFLENKKASGFLASERLRPRCLEIPQKRKPLLFIEESSNRKEPGSCALVLFQVGPGTTENRCMALLSKHILEESLFYELRTKKELGYFVQTAASLNCLVSSVRVHVQGEYCPLYVHQQIEEAIESTFELSPEKFQVYRSALVEKIKRKDQTLREKVGRYWSEIRSGHFCFDRREKNVQFLENVNFEQFKCFAQKCFHSEFSRKILVAIINSDFAKKKDEVPLSNFDVIKNLEKFKEKSPLMPSEIWQ